MQQVKYVCHLIVAPDASEEADLRERACEVAEVKPSLNTPEGQVSARLAARLHSFLHTQLGLPWIWTDPLGCHWLSPLLCCLLLQCLSGRCSQHSSLQWATFT